LRRRNCGYFFTDAGKFFDDQVEFWPCFSRAIFEQDIDFGAPSLQISQFGKNPVRLFTVGQIFCRVFSYYSASLLSFSKQL
jgi:hypothetical protein